MHQEDDQDDTGQSYSKDKALQKVYEEQEHVSFQIKYLLTIELQQILWTEKFDLFVQFNFQSVKKCLMDLFLNLNYNDLEKQIWCILQKQKFLSRFNLIYS